MSFLEVVVCLLIWALICAICGPSDHAGRR